MTRGRKFVLDRSNGKVMGVCAGIAEMTGWDVTLIRVGLTVATLAGGFPWTIIAYFAVVIIATYKGQVKAEERPRVSGARVSAASYRDSTRELDRRLAEVETFVASPNHQLAREIEALR
jgi:phage shock protein C